MGIPPPPLPTLRLLLSVAVILVAVQQPVDSVAVVKPRLEISPKQHPVFINLKEPNETILTCETGGEKPGLFSELKWTGPNRLDNDHEVRKKHQVRTEELVAGNSLTLAFSDPTSSDNGVYHCLGSYQAGDQLNASVEVQFYHPIEVHACQQRQVLIQGSTSGKISCQITGDQLRSSISRDDKLITHERFGGRYKGDGDGLVIDGTVDDRDAGRYVFSAHSLVNGKKVKHAVDVEIISRPEILPYNGTNQEGEFFGVEGLQAKLKCSATGRPKPLFYWLDPQRRNLTSLGGYIVTPEDGTLLITKVDKRFDHGTFECYAYNSVGTVSRAVSMVVDTKPEINSFHNQTVDEYGTVQLECRASGSPQPSFSIRKQGMNQQPYRAGDGLFLEEKIIPEGVGVYVYRLTIKADRNQHGLHYCNATNRAGSAERYNQLSVNMVPDLSSTPPVQFVKIGNEFSIACHIKGYPEPQVSWMIDRTQAVQVQDQEKRSLDLLTHVIKMRPISEQQVAYSTFTCIATNRMGRSEVNIKVMSTTKPGFVSATLERKTPTTVDLALAVPNDGGAKVQSFIYRLTGKTLDQHNPLYSYRDDDQKEAKLDATLSGTGVYTIRNLLPYYIYSMRIRAVNNVGPGDETTVTFDTLKPTRPEPPVLLSKGSFNSTLHSTPGIPSDYSDGHVLQWYPPELDNGDTITNYVVKVYLLADTFSSLVVPDFLQEKTIKQVSDRPLKVLLGPLETNRRYKIELRAENRIGSSEPVIIVIHTKPERPATPEFESRALAWLVEPSTSTLFALIASALVLLVVIDLLFCYFFQMGISFKIRDLCCRSKTESVQENLTGKP